MLYWVAGVLGTLISSLVISNIKISNLVCTFKGNFSIISLELVFCYLFKEELL